MGAWTPPIRRCPCTGWCAMPSMVRRQRLWAGMLPTAAQIPHAATRLTSAGRHGSKIEEWTVCGRLQPGKRLMLLGLRPGWLVWHMQELSEQFLLSFPRGLHRSCAAAAIAFARVSRKVRLAVISLPPTTRRLTVPQLSLQSGTTARPTPRLGRRAPTEQPAWTAGGPSRRGQAPLRTVHQKGSSKTSYPRSSWAFPPMVGRKSFTCSSNRVQP
mmetsp:Transcript_6762/g.19483  ORF Transcript_6762/g.19483 Transcript_6762/m.19483 type:complete len:214 (-) Transcript_6762:1456-2097(-)